jgi:hypothetical protein
VEDVAVPRLYGQIVDTLEESPFLKRSDKLPIHEVKRPLNVIDHEDPARCQKIVRQHQGCAVDVEGRVTVEVDDVE